MNVSPIFRRKYLAAKRSIHYVHQLVANFDVVCRLVLGRWRTAGFWSFSSSAAAENDADVSDESEPEQ